MAPDRGSLPSNHLAAVLLVTTSRPGPKLVFHYPPDPFVYSETTEYDNSEDDSDTDIGIINQPGAGTHGNNAQQPPSASETKTQPATTISGILGFSEESLEKLLSPGCWSDRKRFEVCLDGLTFVGYPVFADHDGSFARKHTHKPSTESLKQKTGLVASDQELRNQVKEVEVIDAVGGMTITEPKTLTKATHDFTHVPESLETPNGPSLATSMQSASSTSGAVLDKLTMFHVVFALTSIHPDRQSTGALDVVEVFDNVAKKLSRALQYCQKQTSYVGLESRKLLSLKAKAKQDGIDSKTLSDQMLEENELAWALKEVYDKISQGDVAEIRLGGMELSLRISRNDEVDGINKLGSHSGLLLLEEKDSLLRELAHPDASALAYVIREHTPTKSLHKQAIRLGIPVDDFLFLSQHLIKWRKARAVAPLHVRNTYIVSPDAPLDQLEKHTIDYAARFSGLPSLPQVLNFLSGKPVKWGQLIPSKDHRTPYMEILAYLVQHRFVSQLKTFGWLQASAERAISKDANHRQDTVNKNQQPMSVASLLSPQLRAVDDDSVSVSSEQTTIPISVVDAANKKAGHGITSAPTAANNNVDDVKIIQWPSHLSAEDTKRFEHIRNSLDDAELSDRLPTLLRYFDGESAFEETAAWEGLKRSKVDAWIELLQREGFVMSYRRL